eukprot:11998641-Karenia_brevis.AAC.1
MDPPQEIGRAPGWQSLPRRGPDLGTFARAASKHGTARIRPGGSSASAVASPIHCRPTSGSLEKRSAREATVLQRRRPSKARADHPAW